jgi:integrase
MAKGLPHGVHRKTAKGRTYYYFDTGARIDGKPVLRRMPDIKDRDFGQAYAQQLAARGRRQTVAPPMTVEQLIKLYEISPDFNDKRPNTQRVYTTYLNVLRDQAGTIVADALNRQDMVLLRDKMAKTTGAANMLIAVTGALYVWGRDRGHVTAEPIKDVTRFDKEDHAPWPEWLVDRALIDDDPIVRLSVHLLYYTAQRIGDVCAFRWTNISDGMLEFTQEKTRTDMTVPIHSKLAAELDRLPKSLGTIINNGGKPYARSTIRRKLQAWALEQGVKVVPHGLRKNAVNALLEADCSIGETSAISGQSLQMVEHYARKRNKRKMASAAILRWEKKGK